MRLKICLVFLCSAFASVYSQSLSLITDEELLLSQEQIILIVQSLNASALIRENIFAAEKLNLEDDRKAYQSEKDFLNSEKESFQKDLLSFQEEKSSFNSQKEYFQQIEKDIPILKDSLEKQETRLTKELKSGKTKTKIIVGVSIFAAAEAFLLFIK